MRTVLYPSIAFTFLFSLLSHTPFALAKEGPSSSVSKTVSAHRTSLLVGHKQDIAKIRKRHREDRLLYARKFINRGEDNITKVTRGKLHLNGSGRAYVAYTTIELSSAYHNLSKSTDAHPSYAYHSYLAIYGAPSNEQKHEGKKPETILVSGNGATPSEAIANGFKEALTMYRMSRVQKTRSGTLANGTPFRWSHTFFLTEEPLILEWHKEEMNVTSNGIFSITIKAKVTPSLPEEATEK